MGEQRSLAEAFMHPGLGRNPRLEALADALDWSALAPLARRVRPGETGRPPHDPLMMLKALYLAALYDLPDAGLEEALSDRLSFRRFVGLSPEDATPDATSVCRFRTDAAASGLVEAAFAAINAQIEAQGLVLKRGSILDATLVAARTAPPKGENVAAGAGRPDEPEAEWTKDTVRRRSFFGYKVHIGADEGSLIVRRAAFTGAKTYESEVADALIVGDERAVYADRAYEKKARRERLKAAGVKDRIMHRRHSAMPALPRWKARRNRLIARRRAPVEGVFSIGKRRHGLGRARLFSFARNAADALLRITAYNLLRMLALRPA